jgi:hypothetical protein
MNDGKEREVPERKAKCSPAKPSLERSALGDITNPQHHFVDLYPPEVVGPKGTLTHEKIPTEAAPGGFIEVIVAEIITPLNFWVHLRGKSTHLALDKLMIKIHLFYEKEAGNYNIPDATIRIGQYCVALYDEEWHQACIIAVHDLVDVQVILVDFGIKCRMKKVICAICTWIMHNFQYKRSKLVLPT